MAFIKDLDIENFKSISKVTLDCKRINLFVGKPNVGKSNVLEALSLFCAGFDSDGYFLKDFIRYDKVSNLFYDQDLNNTIQIHTNIGTALLRYRFNHGEYVFTITNDEEILKKIRTAPDNDKLQTILDTLDKKINTIPNPIPDNINIFLAVEIDADGEGGKYSTTYNSEKLVKKYAFKSFSNISDNSNHALKPPYGENLITILQANSNLRKTVSNYFKEYGLELVLDAQEKTLEIQKRVDDLVYKIPYNLIADTLQRMIFYTAAIESNKDAIIIFEEPESHSFPPYIRNLAERIIDSKENQFFIATHSPYLFNTLISKADMEEVNVFITDFEDYKTTIRQLTEDEIRELLNYGVDVFFNLNLFDNG